MFYAVDRLEGGLAVLVDDEENTSTVEASSREMYCGWKRAVTNLTRRRPPAAGSGSAGWSSFSGANEGPPPGGDRMVYSGNPGISYSKKMGCVKTHPISAYR